MDEYAFQLCGGLRQRAMIAMALSCDPQLLIADEPTTALDVTTQAQILELLRELQEQNGMAIMLITHDLGVVAEMADDVVVMYLGRVVEEGPVDEIFYSAQASVHAGAAALDPQRARDEPRTKLPTISGSIPHPYNRPPGCPFHPRCPSFMPGTCDVYEPQLLRRRTGSRRRAASCTRRPSRRDGDRRAEWRMAGNGVERRPSRRATTLLEVEHLKKFFPIQRGLPAHGRRPGAGRRRRALRRPAGRDAGAGRRERLRQDDDRPLRPARDRSDRRADPVPTADGAVVDVAAVPRASLRPLRREMQMIFQDPFSSLNPRMTLLDIVGEPLLSQRRRQPPGADRPRRGAAAAGRAAAGVHAPLPARVQRRAAPAHRDRAGAGARTRAWWSPTSRSRRSTSRSRRRS